MKRFSEQLKKQSESIRLSAFERRDLRERVKSYMEYHPLPAEMRQAEPTRERFWWVPARATTIHINMFQAGKFFGAIATIVLVAVPLMAEKAVPGDVLYPVKVQFNEEIRGSLSLSPYAKVEWETKRLERRIAEARLLASEGKLTPEVEAEVAEAVKEHSDAAQKEIAALRENDTDEAAIAEIAFTSALDVQSEVLETDIVKSNTASTTGGGNSVLAIAGAVDAVLKTTAQPNETVSYDKLMARIELETTRAYEYFNTVETVASAEEQANIERRLQDIERKVDEAKKLHQAGDTNTSLLATALADTRKLISFMTNIDVRENVAIDDLVPVTLTLEERTDAVNEQLAETARLQGLVEDILPELRVDVAEKTSAGLEELAGHVAIATSSLEQGDIDTAETASAAALGTAHGLAILTKIEINIAENDETATSTATSTDPVEGETDTDIDTASTTATTTEESTDETQASSTEATPDEAE